MKTVANAGRVVHHACESPAFDPDETLDAEVSDAQQSAGDETAGKEDPTGELALSEAAGDQGGEDGPALGDDGGDPGGEDEKDGGEEGGGEMPIPVPETESEEVDHNEVRADDLFPSDGTCLPIGDSTKHKQFPRVLALAKLGMNIFLPGPTGGGKTTIARDVALELKRPFFSIAGTSGTTEGQMFGRTIPNLTNGTEKFQPGPFTKAFTTGGVMLIDEADAMDPNCLLKANAAVGNGFLETEAGNAEKHKDFVCIITANTWGDGATGLYVGRNRFDEAFIDRFRAGTVFIEYDKRIEKLICPDATLFNELEAVREAVMALALRRVISSRFFGDAYKLARGLKLKPKEIVEILMASWSDRERADVQKRLGR